VYSVLANNTVITNRYSSTTKWQNPFVISTGITFSAVSGFHNTDNFINIYFQSEGQHIIEYTSNARDDSTFWPNKRDIPLRR
jgi:hypothetical protein